jgi:ABC-2 type transport system ATP-binding protein
VTSALRVSELRKTYGDRIAVDSISFSVEPGEVFGLLGPNGAGKTTAISMCCGVTTASQGDVAIGGVDLRKEPYAAKRKLGLVPQELAIYDNLSATQNLRYFGAIAGLDNASLAQRIPWALNIAGLADRATEPSKNFSGGMKRRLNLACGIVHKPELLMLDEPTVGVDPQSRNHIFDAVRELARSGMSVVYTSHYMEEVEALCDRIAIMDAGNIVATGRIAELVAQHAGAGVEVVITDAENCQVDESRGNLIRVAALADLASVLAALQVAAISVEAISSRAANLETVFLALTGKALRDQ